MTEETDEEAPEQDGEEPGKTPSPVKTWQIVAAVVALAALLGGGVWIAGQTATYEHNGFVFRETECPTEVDRTCWHTQVVTNRGVHPITFYYGPKQVGDVPVSPAAVENVLNMTRSRNTSVIVAFDEGVPGEVGLAGVQISRITGKKLYNISTTGAVYGRDVTCAAANENRSVVYITQGDTTGVTYRDGCVYVLAKDRDDLLRVADAYGLHLLRILS